MQHSGLAHLLVGFGLTWSVALAAPGNSVAVPVPAEPTSKLPIPHGHRGDTQPVSCKKLDSCLEKSGAGQSALKTCVASFCEELRADKALDVTESRRALCDNQGKKVWDILEEAKDGKPKASLVALSSTHPGTYKKVMAALFSEKSTVFQISQACHVEEHASLRGVLAAKPVPEAVAKVAVPAATKVQLPTPHGHAGIDSDEERTEPVGCSKLDACLAEGAEGDAFKTCIDNFCAELYKDAKFEKKDDHRTQMCDEKGREAWDILAEAGALHKSKKASLVAVRTTHPEAYAAVLQSLFAKSSSVTRASACHVNAAAISRHHA